MILEHQHFDIEEKVILERVIFKPPLKADGTMHNEACFLYAINGKSTLYGADASVDLNSSEGVVMKCGNYLNNWKSSTSEEPYQAVAVHFYPEVLKMVYGDQMPDFLVGNPKGIKTGIQSVKVEEMISKYVESVLFYFENPSLVNDELLKLKVKELLLLLVNTDDSGKIRNILLDLFNEEQYDFKQIIEKHLFHDLSMNDLALLCNVSLSGFKRKFREIYQESPAKYIKQKRLEKAAALLKKSDLRITEVAYQSGFDDISHFTKSFSAQFGQSPTKYRES